MITNFLKPWRALLLVPLLVVALSTAFGLVGVWGLYRAERTYNDLDRFASGKPLAIEIDDLGQRWVWVRHDDYASEDSTTVSVEREGEAVAIRRLVGDVTYQETNTAITAVWAFDADQPGTYTVTGNDINQFATFLVGPGDPQAEWQTASRRIMLGVMGVAFGLVGVLATTFRILRRRGTRSAGQVVPPTSHAVPGAL